MALIYLCDDQDDARKLARFTLQRGGHEVVDFAEGANLLEALAQAVPLPDLLVLDVMMPGISGFELVETLRATPDWADLPVLLLTALNGEEHMEKGIDLGANDYLTKPYSLGELQIRVKGILARRSQLRP